MLIRPLNDTLIIKLDDDRWQDMKKPELIELPEAVIGRYKKRATTGTIVSWGKDCRYPHKQGQKVYFKWYDSRPGFEGFRFVSEKELLAKDEDV